MPTQRYPAERAKRAYVVDLRRPRSSMGEARVANASMPMSYDRSRVVSRDAQQAIDRRLAVHLGLAPP